MPRAVHFDWLAPLWVPLTGGSFGSSRHTVTRAREQSACHVVPGHTEGVDRTRARPRSSQTPRTPPRERRWFPRARTATPRASAPSVSPDQSESTWGIHSPQTQFVTLCEHTSIRRSPLRARARAPFRWYARLPLRRQCTQRTQPRHRPASPAAHMESLRRGPSSPTPSQFKAAHTQASSNASMAGRVRELPVTSENEYLPQGQGSIRFTRSSLGGPLAARSTHAWPRPLV